jgi:hypothetical protein
MCQHLMNSCVCWHARAQIAALRAQPHTTRDRMQGWTVFSFTSHLTTMATSGSRAQRTVASNTSNVSQLSVASQAAREGQRPARIGCCRRRHSCLGCEVGRGEQESVLEAHSSIWGHGDYGTASPTYAYAHPRTPHQPTPTPTPTPTRINPHTTHTHPWCVCVCGRDWRHIRRGTRHWWGQEEQEELVDAPMYTYSRPPAHEVRRVRSRCGSETHMYRLHLTPSSLGAPSAAPMRR